MTISDIFIERARKIGPFSFDWGRGVEHFRKGWEADLRAGDRAHRLRHGIGRREVFGDVRVHTVTWLDGVVRVEGVAADDYKVTRALISRLKKVNRTLVRSEGELPPGYEGYFHIVNHSEEIDAPYSPDCLAVKIREDDLDAWARHAWLRTRLFSFHPDR